MPNHVQNIIHINAEKETIIRILLEIQEDEAGIGSIDFNKLIPMPKTLNIESGSTTDRCIELYVTSINPMVHYFGDNKVSANEYVAIINKLNSSRMFSQYNGNLPKQKVDDFMQNLQPFSSVEQMLERGKQAVDNLQKYGSKDWYDWSIKNWDTKWNAYDYEQHDENTIAFYTAWSPPQSILRVLSEKYPEVIFSHSWADEDMGVNVGKQVYQDGMVIEEDIPEAHSKESYEMAADIWGVDLEEHGLHLSKDGTAYEYVEDENEDDEEL